MEDPSNDKREIVRLACNILEAVKRDDSNESYAISKELQRAAFRWYMKTDTGD